MAIKMAMRNDSSRETSRPSDSFKSQFEKDLNTISWYGWEWDHGYKCHECHFQYPAKQLLSAEFKVNFARHCSRYHQY